MSMKKLFDIDKHDLMFHNKALFALLIPIVVEQLLNSFMGMVDTMMVSNLGSQAISGVSLVDSVNNLIVQLFSAMATGAAIICSHYIGMRNKDGANKAARQVVLTVMAISLAIMLSRRLWIMRWIIFCLRHLAIHFLHFFQLAQQYSGLVVTQDIL